MTQAKRRKQYLEDRRSSSGITAFFTTFYVIASIPILTSWLMAEGLVPTSKWTWVVAGVLVFIVSLIQKPLYEKALDTIISGPGCLGGLITYGIGVVLCLILFWKGGLEGLIIGILLVPILSFGIAFLVTVVGPDSPGGGKKKSSAKLQPRRKRR
jgi:hypothetical protein